MVVNDTAYLSGLQTTAHLAESGGSTQEVVERVRRELVGLLGLRGCRFEYGSLLGHLPRLEHDGGVWLRQGTRITQYAEWPQDETELRIVGGGHYYGRFLLDPGRAPCRRRRPGSWPSRWPRRRGPPWTRPASPTRADRPEGDGPPGSRAPRFRGRPFALGAGVAVPPGDRAGRAVYWDGRPRTGPVRQERP